MHLWGPNAFSGGVWMSRVSRWKNPLILTIDPNFLSGTSSRRCVCVYIYIYIWPSYSDQTAGWNPCKWWLSKGIPEKKWAKQFQKSTFSFFQRMHPRKLTRNPRPSAHRDKTAQVWGAARRSSFSDSSSSSKQKRSKTSSEVFFKHLKFKSKEGTAASPRLHGGAKKTALIRFLFFIFLAQNGSRACFHRKLLDDVVNSHELKALDLLKAPIPREVTSESQTAGGQRRAWASIDSARVWDHWLLSLVWWSSGEYASASHVSSNRSSQDPGCSVFDESAKKKHFSALSVASCKSEKCMRAKARMVLIGLENLIFKPFRDLTLINNTLKFTNNPNQHLVSKGASSSTLGLNLRVVLHFWTLGYWV